MFTKGNHPDSKKSRTIELPLTDENFEDARAFVEQRLTHNHISSTIIHETVLLFETLYNSLREQESGSNILLTITTHKSFGEFRIELGFEGDPFVPPGAGSNEISPELNILRAYKDRYTCRYSYGYNTIDISVKRSYGGLLLRCWAGILLAILVYIPIRMNLSMDDQIALENNIIYPSLKQFANAMLMVGAPITFFSMLRNLTDIHILAKRHSPLRKLRLKSYATSCIAIALGIITASVGVTTIRHLGGYLDDAGGTPPSVSEMINSLVPSSLFEPFETYMPFPLIIVALLSVYALCSAGEYIDILKKVVDICYTLFSKMLNVVMYFLPLFSFLAMLTPLLTTGFVGFFMIVQLLVVIIVSLVVLCVFYTLRLIIGGVKVGPFFRHMPALILENLRINSVIDAVPFNIRFCARNFGFNRKHLSEKLPILAQINLDGNCYLLILLALTLIFGLGIHVSWAQIVVIAILVLFLSLGAPNQPGSILIGVLIILFYLDAADLISMAIYLEVFCGMIQNIINVTGDIVTVAIDERKTNNKDDRKGHNMNAAERERIIE